MATTRRNILIVVLLTVVVVGGLLSVWLFEKSQREPGTPEVLKKQIIYEGQTYTMREDLETILFIGLDTFSNDTQDDTYRNDQQADFLLLVVCDKTTGQYSAVHINRDTIAKVRVLGIGGRVVDVREQQIALSHAYGSGGSDSCINTVRAVSGLLHDVTIDHYVTMTMDAVKGINDLVGGVEVTVMDDFTSVDPAMVQGKTMTLMGDQALYYVRSRSNLADPTNIHRMERQRQYMTGLWKKMSVAMKNDDQFAVNMMKDFSDCIQTDYSVAQVENLMDRVSELQMENIYTIEGESVKGEQFMEFHVDEDALMTLLVRLFYEPEG